MIRKQLALRFHAMVFYTDFSLACVTLSFQLLLFLSKAFFESAGYCALPLWPVINSVMEPMALEIVQVAECSRTFAFPQRFHGNSLTFSIVGIFIVYPKPTTLQPGENYVSGHV